MNRGALRRITRNMLDDNAGAPTHLQWIDDELNDFLDRAEQEACERAHLLTDSTIAACSTLAIIAGTASYPLHAKVLEVVRVELASDPGRALRITDRDWLDRTSPSWAKLNGIACCMIEERRLIFVGKPTANDTATLQVDRLPITGMVDDNASPEIEDAHHFNLVHWALRLAYLKDNTETLDTQASARHEAIFERAFGIREDANTSRQQRANHVPVTRMNSGW